MTSNLLDEAIGLDDSTSLSPLVGRLLLVEDCVETSGAFVLHHLLKRAFSSPHSSNAVIFIAFSQSFVHYDRVLRKLVRSRYLCMCVDVYSLDFFAICWFEFGDGLFSILVWVPIAHLNLVVDERNCGGNLLQDYIAGPTENSELLKAAINIISFKNYIFTSCIKNSLLDDWLIFFLVEYSLWNY